MMDNGHSLGLLMMYSVMAIYALIMLRVLIQIFFGAAIENHHRRQWMQTHATERRKSRAQKRGWANASLPKSPAANPPASNNKARGWAVLPILVTQAFALISIFLALGMASVVAAQTRPARDLSSPDLRKQLIDIRAREIQLRIRLEQIDQELKPEAIERELAGVGSVHPEELRENRRKLLSIERNGLQAELDLLEEYRASVEKTIAIDEEAAALMNYDRPAPAPPSPQPQMALSLRNVRHSQLVLKLFGGLCVLILLAGGLFLLLIVAFQIYAHLGGTPISVITDALRERSTATPPRPLERAQV